MQQIAKWLEALGMSEYVQRFAENRIDFSVLADLTDKDLKVLGIVLGDRFPQPLPSIANGGVRMARGGGPPYRRRRRPSLRDRRARQ